MNTKNIIFTALFAALTCVATMIIKLPTPTMGYIHPGDAIVLLSGLLLGPWYGSFAAGLGSMLADLFSGYLSYAPATFMIKFFTAFIACVLFKSLKKVLGNVAPVIIAGTVGEAFMVMGYFLFEIFMLAVSTGGKFSTASLTAGITASASGIPFNIVQGIFGVIIATILYPILVKVFHSMEEK